MKEILIGINVTLLTTLLMVTPTQAQDATSVELFELGNLCLPIGLHITIDSNNPKDIR